MKYTPTIITELKEGEIIVFGSNAQGDHYGGLAKVCFDKFGAICGQGNGLQGQCYAINTMSGIDIIIGEINEFILFAKDNSDFTFLVTLIGCGIAGYSPKDIAPLFPPVLPSNIILPIEFSTQ